jgi:hypothetical protein
MHGILRLFAALNDEMLQQRYIFNNIEMSMWIFNPDFQEVEMDTKWYPIGLVDVTLF